MAKLFNSIRKKLVSDKPSLSRTSNYIKYAIGEIVLVVIGILIALSINTWNEGRKKAITEKEFVSGIVNDLNQDKNYIDLVIKLANKKHNTYKHISNNLPELYKTNRKYLDSLLGIYFVSQRTFYPIFGSYQSAISGNEIGKFKNKKFSAVVTKLYNSTYDRIHDNGDILDRRWEFISKKYSYERRTGFLREMNNSQLIEFLDDLSYHMKALDFYVEQLNDARVEISDLLNQEIKE